MKRVLVCGGRKFARPDLTYPEYFSPANTEQLRQYRFVNSSLDDILGREYPECWSDNEQCMFHDITIITGSARGVDTAAIDWAICNWLPFEEYKADWKKLGLAAGPIRNQQMLDTGIDLVIAFPGGKGTADMVRRAKRKGVKVIEVDYIETQ